MKKSGVLFGILFLLIIGMFFVSAELTTVERNEKIDDAYTCLNDEIDTLGCSRIGWEDKPFVLLTTGECYDDFLDSEDEVRECWPEGNCDLKTTAISMLGINRLGENTTLAEEWLLSHTKVPDELDWFLEIDGLEEMTCTVSDGTSTSEFIIGEDKKLVGTARGCLEKSFGDYWLKIKSSCYDREFVTSCDQRFITTLLFQEEDSDTINIVDDVHVAGTDGETTEKINALCFEENGVCDYEGSLWSTLVLDYLDQNISGAFPYLITGIENHPRLLPESFVYSLTNSLEYKTDLLEKQISEEYWQESGDQFYDTALALLPFQYDNLVERENSENWLLDIQEEEGCWDDKNLKNTAFILYSLWDKNINRSRHGDFVGNFTDDSEDCVELGNHCMSRYSCKGNVLASLGCTGTYVCCDVPLEEKTCFDEDGIVCSRDEECTGATLSTSGLGSGEICCVSGTCEEINIIPPEGETCVSLGGGVCEAFGCESGYESSYLYDCADTRDTCCIKEDKPGNPWIWVLFVLIGFVVLGIVFRDKLRMFMVKMKSKFGSKKGPGPMRPGRPGMPPGYSRAPRMGPPTQRRIIPRETMPQRNIPRTPLNRSKPKAPRELDDVLKKLKEMSK